MKTLLFHIKTQGGPRIDTGTIVAEGENVVALSIDLHSKYCEVVWLGADEKGVPLIGLFRTERSLYLTRGKQDKITEIIFPTFAPDPDGKTWQVWSADCSRYTLRVCLVKETA